MNTTVTVLQAKKQFDELMARALRGEQIVIRERSGASVTLMRFPDRRKNGDKPRRLHRALKTLNQRFQLTVRQQRRLEALAGKHKQTSLTAGEKQELQQLLHELESLSRSKARALAQL